MTETKHLLMTALADLQKTYRKDIEILSNQIENYSMKVENLSTQMIALDKRQQEYLMQVKTLSGELIKALEH